MKYTGKFLTLIFAMILLVGSTAITASAQRRGGRVIKRPVVVRHYYVRPNPFWYWNTWGNPYYYYDPYISISRQRYDLERELSGNKRELRKHLEKYNADGVITAKEREELDDDYRDVARAQRELNEFIRRYYR